MSENNHRISRKTGKPVTTVGGSRPGAGRKRRLEEHEIMERLSPLHDIAIAALSAGLEKNDMKAVDIYFRYAYGLPTQRIENKIEGNLNSVSVEVIKPELSKVA
jgi:hypothetical protein